MRAVVSSPICPLYLRPSAQCELADEALLGWTVEILDEAAPGWYQVRTDYGYTGYAPAAGLTVGDGNAKRWEALRRRTVIRGVCSVRSAPKVQGWQITLLPRGAEIAVHGEPDANGWQQVSLPDGREGYTKTGFLFDVPRLEDEASLRAHIVSMARLYQDAHYLWGGKTTLGIDCSGLSFMAYRLSGVTIWRDASIREGYPIHAVDPAQVKPGDLLFFPGHVAVYMGDGRYIHSTARNGSDGVVVNSLRPEHEDFRPDLLERLTSVGSLF
ncbi:MAG: C40 family peptidase [Oscillospiraceae bacterium]|nr:C40 family peptidase [Oscillospiraceae bacterium]